MMKQRNIIAILLISCIFLLAGCAMVQEDKPGASIEPQLTAKFSDIPIPSGFTSIPDQSYFFESSGIRVGALKFRGKGDSDEIVNFYKEQMPIHNWNLLNVVEYGDKLLNFDRENETCVITLVQKGKNIIITISLGPKSQTVTKKAKKGPIK